MKKIDTSQVISPISKQPFTVDSLKFKQDYDVENYSALVKALITQSTGSYSLTIPYVISGCVLSGTYNITAGEIFYGGNFYNVTALSSSVNPIRLILTTTYDTTADPLTFTDGVAKNVHEIYTYVSTDIATGGILASSLVSAYGSGKTSQQITLATQTTNSSSYIDMTGLTYTTPNDGITRKYRLFLKGVSSPDVPSNNSGTPIFGGGYFQIYNDTLTTELDASKHFIYFVANSSVGDSGLYDISNNISFFCSTIVTLAPNTVLKCRFKNDGGTNETITDVKFLIEEV
jgi:hypothetical protein